MARVRVSQHVVEVLVGPTPTSDPATPTGAGISQHVVEVLGTFPSAVRLSQHVLEVLVSDGDTVANALEPEEVTHVQTKGNKSSSVTLDSAPTIGNLLIAVATVYTGNMITGWPSGWYVANSAYGNVGSNRRLEVAYKIAGYGESATIGFTASGYEDTLVVSEYTGWWSTPFSAALTKIESGTSMSAPSVVPFPGRQAVIVMAYSCWDGARTTTWPDGITERYSASHDSENSFSSGSGIIANTSGSYNGTVSGTSSWGQIIGTYAFVADTVPSATPERAPRATYLIGV